MKKKVFNIEKGVKDVEIRGRNGENRQLKRD
jgi:hypothetical protein